MRHLPHQSESTAGPGRNSRPGPGFMSAQQIGDDAVVDAGQRIARDDATGEDLHFALRRGAAQADQPCCDAGEPRPWRSDTRLGVRLTH